MSIPALIWYEDSPDVFFPSTAYIAHNDTPPSLCVDIDDKTQVTIRLDDIFKAVVETYSKKGE